MSKWQILLWISSLLIVMCNALPVVPKDEESKDEDHLLDDEDDTGLEYDRYLRQVIKVLEKDPEMRKRMEEMSLEDLKEGNFARELGFLSANIRSKLDELKRLEVQRLRTAARLRMEAANGKGMRRMDQKALEGMVGHVDPNSMDKFTDTDFERLIKKAAADLDEADQQRKKEFKRYEMEKELQRRQKLKELDEVNRQKVQKEFEERKEKLKNHPKLKHPGSKAQMEEIWEETDHLDPQDFNPKTFFALHDTNNDKKLDMFELEALFIKEVSKIYEDDENPDPVEFDEEISRMREHVLKEVEKIYKDTEADPKEKFEEMSRMREHVLREIDLDGDKMVSRMEFLKAADQEQYNTDEGWKDLNQEDQFTEDELEEYNKMVQERLERKKIRMQEEHDRYLNQQNLNHPGKPNADMNQQINLNQQPPQPGQDNKLRVNQPPVNQQVPVNQGQVPVQQQGQPPVNQAAQQPGQPAQQGRQQPARDEQPIVAKNLAEQQLLQQQHQQKLQQHKLQQQQQQQQQQPNVQIQQGQPIQGQPIQGQPIQGQPIQGQTIQGKHIQGQPIQGQPIQGQPIQGQPIQGQPIQGQPIQGQPIQGQPIQEQPIQGQAIQGQPIQGQPIQGKPIQGQPIQGQPIQGQPIQGKPIQGQPIQGQPIQGQPIQGQPIQGQPIQGQPIQGQPIQGKPIQGQPIHVQEQATIHGQNQPQKAPEQPLQGQNIQGHSPAQAPQGQGIQGQPPAQAPQGQGIQGQPPAQAPQGQEIQGQPPAQAPQGQGDNPPGPQ